MWTWICSIWIHHRRQWCWAESSLLNVGKSCHCQLYFLQIFFFPTIWGGLKLQKVWHPLHSYTECLWGPIWNWQIDTPEFQLVFPFSCCSGQKRLSSSTWDNRTIKISTENTMKTLVDGSMVGWGWFWWYVLQSQSHSVNWFRTVMDAVQL